MKYSGPIYSKCQQFKFREDKMKTSLCLRLAAIVAVPLVHAQI